jgi:dolichyl-diphosphooligosaccharide--protein glycosyltransferase
MLFLIYLITGKGNKNFWLFTILTGISLGLYFLTWPGALLFLFIIFCFIVFYYLIKYLLGHNEDWILLAGCVIFFIALLMIAPFFGMPDFINGAIYNIRAFVCFACGILIFLITGVLGYFLKNPPSHKASEGQRKNKKVYFLPLFLFLGAIISAIALKLFFPFLWDTIIKTALEVNYGATIGQSARQGTSEMGPLRISGAFANFSALFYISLVALCIFIYKFIKDRKPEHFLIIVWTLIILFACGIIPAFGQRRNSYYLSVCISLLSAFLIVEGFKFGWQALRKADEFAKSSYLRFYFSVSSIVIIFTIIFFFLYPFPFNIDNQYPSSLPLLMQTIINTAKSPLVRSNDWYDTFEWLKDNTPDPGLDYYALYKAPYNYPSQAYGILAIWDMGHDITYYSHRIPVANPFQQGIGYINNDGSVVPGEGTFFLATDEKQATDYLDQLRAKYVILDSSLSDPNGPFRIYIKWINGNMDEYTSDNISETEPNKFDLAMSTRLYLLDGSYASMPKTTTKGEKINLAIPALSHFRLLYESKSNTSIFLEQDYKKTKQVKVFEYVKGAKITGRATPGSEIVISTNVITNQGEEFIYQNSIKTEDGSFEFVVPYSTGNQVNSEVSADVYEIKIGSYVKRIKVSEDDILQGRTINVQ